MLKAYRAGASSIPVQIIRELGIPDAIDNLVYVADSASVIKENLALIRDKEIKFISCLPATFKQERLVKEQAWADGKWQEVGVVARSPKRDSATYRSQDCTAVIDDKPYRLIAVHSLKLDKRKANTLKRRLDKEKAELEERIAELGAVEFVCEPDAVNALERRKKECSGLFYGVSGNVGIEEDLLERTRRGRPRKGEEAPTKATWRVKASVGPLDEEAYTQAKQRASCFVLVTNIHDTKEWPAKKVLREYKEQSCVELSFKAIKGPEFVGAMYVKKPECLEILAYEVLLAALVRTVMQR